MTDRSSCYVFGCRRMRVSEAARGEVGKCGGAEVGQKVGLSRL